MDYNSINILKKNISYSENKIQRLRSAEQTLLNIYINIENSLLNHNEFRWTGITRKKRDYNYNNLHNNIYGKLSEIENHRNNIKNEISQIKSDINNYQSQIYILMQED